MKSYKINLSVFILSFIFGFCLLYSQNDVQSKYNLAKSYEKGGDFENASRLYKELYDKEPASELYFEAIYRTYKAQNRFVELNTIIEERLKKYKSYKLYGFNGEMLWKIGSFDKAKEAWKKALDDFEDDQSKFLFIANIQKNLPAIDQAIETLKMGRDRTGDNTLYIDDLSRLYIANGNFVDGTEEIIKELYITRNVAEAEGKIYALMMNDSANVYIGSRLQDEAGKNDRHLGIQELYAFFLRTTKQFQKAFEVVKILDSLKGGTGREIVSFANTSRGDGHYKIALDAYAYLIDNDRYRRYLATALYGYARTMEDELDLHEDISKEEIRLIIERYRNIIEKYPREYGAADSRYRIAVLSEDYLSDYKTAIEELETLIKFRSGSKLAAMGLLRLARINTIQDNLKKSEELYNKVTKTYRKIAPDEFLEAEYRLAELQYFKGNIDSALVMFKNISVQKDSRPANDALEKLALIEDNKELTQALKMYAEAELYILRKDLNKAKELLMKISNQSEGKSLFDISIMKAIEISFDKGDYQNSIELADKLVAGSPESIYGDKAALIKGKSLLKEKKNTEALKVFTGILVKYPRSIYLNETRELIKQMRRSSNI